MSSSPSIFIVLSVIVLLVPGFVNKVKSAKQNTGISCSIHGGLISLKCLDSSPHSIAGPLKCIMKKRVFHVFKIFCFLELLFFRQNHFVIYSFYPCFKRSDLRSGQHLASLVQRCQAAAPTQRWWVSKSAAPPPPPPPKPTLALMYVSWFAGLESIGISCRQKY